MSDRDLMQQALKALETNQPVNYCMNNNGEKFPMMQEDPFRFDRNTKAIAALRERLAQPEMEPCAGRNCGSTNPNLHSAECFEDYEKSTGMNQWQGLTDEEINSVRYKRDWTAAWTDTTFARAIEAKLREKNT